jgi:hypothetical protein
VYLEFEGEEKEKENRKEEAKFEVVTVMNLSKDNELYQATDSSLTINPMKQIHKEAHPSKRPEKQFQREKPKSS